MILKTALSGLVLTLLSSNSASAHSDYWRCAQRAGAENVQAQCGDRSDFDRTGELGGANAPTPQQREEKRRNEERQQDEMRRQEERRRDDQRRDDERRADEERRRENDRRDEEDRRRRDESYEQQRREARQPSRSRTTRQDRVREEAPPRIQDEWVPIEVNMQSSSINVGAGSNIDSLVGYKIKGVRVEASTSGNSKVNVIVGGVRVGGIRAEQPGEYEKDFSVVKTIKRGSRNLVITSEGDVTILRVSVLLGK